MLRQRIRVRFAKKGDLRLISHRDLVRAFERLFRRAGVALAMSEGFHPHPRMTFPAALALGIEGRDEVADVVLADESQGECLRRRLVDAAPTGLEINSVQSLQPHQRKAVVRWAHYEMPVPPARWAAAQRAVDNLRAQQVLSLQRAGGTFHVVLATSLDRVSLRDGILGFRLDVCAQTPLRPREVLESLQLDDLQWQGVWLSRTSVELAS